MSREKIDVLVDVPDEYRRFCDDYKDRSGCGQEVKIIRNARGKSVACEPVQIPCLDNDGNTVWCWVPHWVTCPEQREYALGFMRDKAESNAEWRRNNAKDDNSSRREYR